MKKYIFIFILGFSSLSYTIDLQKKFNENFDLKEFKRLTNYDSVIKQRREKALRTIYDNQKSCLPYIVKNFSWAKKLVKQWDLEKTNIENPKKKKTKKKRKQQVKHNQKKKKEDFDAILNDFKKEMATKETKAQENYQKIKKIQEQKRQEERSKLRAQFYAKRKKIEALSKRFGNVRSEKSLKIALRKRCEDKNEKYLMFDKKKDSFSWVYILKTHELILNERDAAMKLHEILNKKLNNSSSTSSCSSIEEFSTSSCSCDDFSSSSYSSSDELSID